MQIQSDIKTNNDSATCYNQGSNGIRQWTLIRVKSPMMIHKITPSVDYNKWLQHLDTQLNKPTNPNKFNESPQSYEAKQ